MQFHRNGFRPGDPAVADAAAALSPAPPDRALPGEVDVLIVGSGPTGLTLAAQLAAFPDLSVAVAEAKPGPLTVGQADGIACRSLEMFHAFGFAHKVLHEAYHVNETVFWKPDPDRPDQVRRSHRIQDVEDGLSEMPHVILNQARIHDFFLEVMANAERPILPHHGRRFVGLERPAGDDEPVVARFETATGGTEVVRARYVVGCDGARSEVRRALGRGLVGDAANQAWGVMDVLGVTDFPDIRFKVIMHAEAGNLVLIPREGGYLVRFYIELDKLADGERAADRNVDLADIVDVANRILHPYTLEPAEVPWWSVYEIGQRLCDRFDDVEADEVGRRSPRVFIAGDACHTHSPKAGQGMNVSMRDGFNLGWKLAAVVRGLAAPTVLDTYTDERHAVARELIDFDRELASMMSARPVADDEGSSGDGVDPAVFQQYFQQHGRFMAGVATRYGSSLLTSATPDQDLAKGFVVGTRFHSGPVARVADGRVTELGQVARADGRWRLYAFADAALPLAPTSRLGALCRFLADDPGSPLVRYTRAGADVDALFDVRAVLQQSYHDVAAPDLPPLLAPRVGALSLIDYEKAFSARFKGGPDIFDLRGIDRERGALVVVRPDQHVATVLGLDATDELAAFFDRFLLPAG